MPFVAKQQPAQLFVYLEIAYYTKKLGEKLLVVVNGYDEKNYAIGYGMQVVQDK